MENRKISSDSVAFLILFIFLSFFYFSFGTLNNLPRKIFSDGVYYYHYLASLVEDHDLDFYNNYTAPPPYGVDSLDPHNYLDKTYPSTGKPINMFFIGPAILWLSFYALAYIFALILNTASFPINPSIYSSGITARNRG